MKYGDVVTYVRNGVELNALVLQSTMEDGNETLLLAYLDPAQASKTIHSVSTTVATAFSVKPLVEGMVHGWLLPAADRIEGSPREVVEAVQFGAASEEIAKLRFQLSTSVAAEDFERVKLALAQRETDVAELTAKVESMTAELASRPAADGAPSAADPDTHSADVAAKAATSGDGPPVDHL